MILAISTSSPYTSAALLNQSGAVLASGIEHAPRSASTSALHLLDSLLNEAQTALSDIDLFVGDVGPGSFTGVKVGVTLAKTWAYAQQKPVAAVSAFDLISPDSPAAIPIRRGVVFGRDGDEVRQLEDAEISRYVGYAEGCSEQVLPDAKRVAALLDRLKPISPFELTAEYHLAPSISQAKKPLIMGEGHG